MINFKSFLYIYMVYRKQVARRTYKAQPWYNQKFTAGDIAAKAWEGVKTLKGIINSELKEVTVNNTVGYFYTGGNLNLISGIGTGDTETGREGNSVLAKTLQLRFHTAWQSATGTSLNRVIVFRDKQAVAHTTPAFADVLETDIMGRINHKNEKRFAVLMDKTFPTDSTMRSKLITKTIPLNQHLLWDGINSTDTVKNPIYLLTVGDTGSTGTNGNVFKYSAKLNYYDN